MNVLQEVFGTSGVGETDFLRSTQTTNRHGRRMEAQVDAMLRCRHGDNYQPPSDDEMGDVILSNVIADPELIKSLLESKQCEGTDPPPQPPNPPSRLGWLFPLLCLLLCLLTVAVVLLLAQLLLPTYRYEFVRKRANDSSVPTSPVFDPGESGDRPDVRANPVPPAVAGPRAEFAAAADGPASAAATISRLRD